MADWKKLLKAVLLVDGNLDAAETALIKKSFLADGAVDKEEADFLDDLKKSAKSTCKEFDEFVLSARKK